MFDASPMYPESWHPAIPRYNHALSRVAPYVSRLDCARPIRYHFIDFGLSFKASVSRSGDRSVPEYASQSRDPF